MLFNELNRGSETTVIIKVIREFSSSVSPVSSFCFAWLRNDCPKPSTYRCEFLEPVLAGAREFGWKQKGVVAARRQNKRLIVLTSSRGRMHDAERSLV